MQSSVEPTLSGLGRQRQRIINLGECLFRALPLCLDFREQPSIERQVEFVALTGVFRQRPSKRSGGVPIAELRARPGRGQWSKGQIERKTVLSAERDNGFAVRQAASASSRRISSQAWQ